MKKDEKTLQDLRSQKGIFKKLFRKNSGPKPQDKTMLKFQEIINKKRLVLDEIRECLRDIQRQASDSEILDLVRYGAEQIKKVNSNIVCAVFQSKNELLGLNLKKEPTFIKIYKLGKNCFEPWKPIRVLALDITEGIDMRVHFFSALNSSTHKCLKFKNDLIKKGLSNSIRYL